MESMTSPKPTTERPITEPALKATRSAGFKPFLAAFAVLTLDDVAMTIPITEVIEDVIAPAKKQAGVGMKMPESSTANKTPNTTITKIART